MLMEGIWGRTRDRTIECARCGRAVAERDTVIHTLVTDGYPFAAWVVCLLCSIFEPPASVVSPESGQTAT